MKSTKVLLSITNLKKYFPVAKTSVFQRKRLYVRANEDITIDIYEGETLGVVGESGCGKSTLGRVLLQLYPQTAGNTIYYGKKLDDMTPKYVIETLNKLPKYRERYAKAVAKTLEFKKKVDESGGEEGADFYLLQDYNLAKCEEQTALHSIVKIIGGFMALPHEKAGIELLKKLYALNCQRNKLVNTLHDIETQYNHVAHPPVIEDNGKARELSEEKQAQYHKKVAAKLKKLSDVADKHKLSIKAIEDKIAKLQRSLAETKQKYSSNADFAAFEVMLDDGIDLARLKYNEMRVLRKDLQIVFQDPYSSLNPRFTIARIIEEGLITHKFYKHGSPLLRKHIVNTMLECGLQEYMLHRYPHQFSGGQRQRISIARALAVNPKFVVCDECVSALDVSIQSQIINLLEELKEKENLTYMFISHDLSVVRYISDRICVMYLGNIVELADSATVFEDPRHPYTVALLSSIPTTDPDDLKKERIILEGNIPSPIMPPSGCKFHTRCYMACEKCRRVPPPLREIEPGHFLACHFPERKLDANGNYLFEVTNTEALSTKQTEAAE